MVWAAVALLSATWHYLSVIHAYYIHYALSLVLFTALGIISVQLDGRSGTSSPPWGFFTDGLGLVWGIFSGEGDLALPPALQLVHCRESFLFCQGDGELGFEG